MPNPDEAGVEDGDGNPNPAAAGSSSDTQEAEARETSSQGSSESGDDARKKKGRRMSTALGGSPVLLRIESDIRRRYIYVSKGPNKPRDKATQLRILGRVVAKVTASYV